MNSSVSGETQICAEDLLVAPVLYHFYEIGSELEELLLQKSCFFRIVKQIPALFYLADVPPARSFAW